jgi:hypothetical protein
MMYKVPSEQFLQVPRPVVAQILFEICWFLSDFVKNPGDLLKIPEICEILRLFLSHLILIQYFSKKDFPSVHRTLLSYLMQMATQDINRM